MYMMKNVATSETGMSIRGRMAIDEFTEKEVHDKYHENK